MIKSQLAFCFMYQYQYLFIPPKRHQFWLFPAQSPRRVRTTPNPEPRHRPSTRFAQYGPAACRMAPSVPTLGHVPAT